MHSNEDEDFIAISEKEEEKSEHAIQLPPHTASFSSTDMVRVMKQAFRGVESFTPPGHIQAQPSFYETEHAFIFPPSSDDPDAQMLPHLADTLKRNVNFLKNHPRLESKLWLFPVAEELVLGFPILNRAKAFIPPRNHWVTLCYNPVEKTATVLDSRPYQSAGTYSISSMTRLLSDGLKNHGLNVKAYTPIISQGIQPDNIHCGRWTLINLILLAQGISLQDIQRDLREEDFQHIPTYLDSLARGEQPGTFIMQAYRKQTPDTVSSSRSDSSDSLLELNNNPYGDEIDALMGQAQQACIKIACQSFEKYFTDTATKLRFFVAEQSIYWNGRLIEAIDDGAHLERILYKLEEKYAKIPRESLRSKTDLLIDDSGYTLKDPSRLGTWLARIGIPNHEIDALSISQLILINQALICAQQAYKTVFFEARAKFIETVEEQARQLVEEALENKMRENGFEVLIHIALRDEVYKELQSHLKASPTEPLTHAVAVSSGTPSAGAQEGIFTDEGAQHVDHPMIKSMFIRLPKQAHLMLARSINGYALSTSRGLFLLGRILNTSSVPRHIFTAQDRAFRYDVLHSQNHPVSAQPGRLITYSRNEIVVRAPSSSIREKHDNASREKDEASFERRENHLLLPPPGISDDQQEGADGSHCYISVSINDGITEEDVAPLDALLQAGTSHRTIVSNARNLLVPEDDAGSDTISHHSFEDIPLEDNSSNPLENDTSHAKGPNQSLSQGQIISLPPQAFYQNSHFQLRCLQALFAVSLALAALTILISPLAAPAVGLALGASLATGVMAASASLAGVTLASSCYGFYARQKNIASTEAMRLANTL